jgi:YidC/Oxa1 family membrane protein insertase
MQGMDRNTIIGFVLLAGLLFAYLFFASKGSQDAEAQRKRVEDSLARVAAQKQVMAEKKDTSKTIKVDTGAFVPTVFNGTEKTTVVENEVLRIVFSNKGGEPSLVQLKQYKSFDGTPVRLMNGATDKLSYNINISNNDSKASADLFFDNGAVVKNADGSQSITYDATLPNGGVIHHQYTVRPNDYMIDWNVKLQQADKLLTQGNFNFIWHATPLQHESDVKYERLQSNICFVEDNDFDYILSKTEKKFEKPVQWVGVSQQFFNATIIAKNNFSSGDVKWTKPNDEDTSGRIAEVTATLQAKVPQGAEANVPMQLYFGPNDYATLKKQAPEMDKMVNLGRDMYAFVRPINKFIVMPVFHFFKNFISSYGLVIALLTLFIRLLTSPLVYTSYLSGAKMKALRPELDILKKKFPDQQQYGMEQMKLFREAGVNPLGGCIPALLQIPIFFALYSFFNSNIDLRAQSFLWADNLASYDSIAKLPFYVPGYGDHVSLFTLTAVATSFLISIYNMSMTPSQDNPALKYMPYIFPFILLFIFNRLPAALTWYYTVSNVITLILQWVIQNYIIDHDKILAKLEENRKKPKSKSKWQERLEQMQETQKKVQNTRNKAGK